MLGVMVNSRHQEASTPGPLSSHQPSGASPDFVRGSGECRQRHRRDRWQNGREDLLHRFSSTFAPAMRGQFLEITGAITSPLIRTVFGQQMSVTCSPSPSSRMTCPAYDAPIGWWSRSDMAVVQDCCFNALSIGTLPRGYDSSPTPAVVLQIVPSNIHVLKVSFAPDARSYFAKDGSIQHGRERGDFQFVLATPSR